MLCCASPAFMPATVTASRSLPDLSTEELTAWMTEQGYKATHTLPVLREVYGARAGGQLPKDRLPAGLMEHITSTFPREAARLVRRQVSEDGTCKLLLCL